MAMTKNWTANFGVALSFLVVSARSGGYEFVLYRVIFEGTPAFEVWELLEGVVGGGERGDPYRCSRL